jgi:DNA polymerase I-like protein with 3'-5' exonuclease and polymerase domains
VGIFWDDLRDMEPAKVDMAGRVRVAPPIPDTGWKPVASVNELPSLRGAKLIALDTETRDPDLRTKGPGVRRDAYLVGVSVGTDDGFRTYLPIRHELQKEWNLEPEHVFAWLRDNLGDAHQPKVGANILYDLDMLAEAGVPVRGDIHDVQIAEPLLDENCGRYALEILGRRHLGEGKTSDALYDWLAAAYGGQPNSRDQAGNIWRSPISLAGPYAIGDIDLPLRILAKQQTLLAAEGLTELYGIERQLIPMLLAMRRRGVRVDKARAKDLDHDLMLRAEALRQKLLTVGIDPNSSDTIAPYCDHKGIKYPRTPKGAPSFVATWLNVQSDEMLEAVLEVRKLEKHAGTFLQGHILGHEIRGRIHCQFHQLRGDEYGAVSGRFSSSDPNLQNIPTRDEEIGPLIRAMFLPDEGEQWGAADYSQIEYRFLVHYGFGPSAKVTRDAYHSDPTTDFHKYVAQISGIDRKPAKNINFGLVYGMGKDKLARNLGRTVEEANPIFEQYHRTFPFIKELYDEVAKVAGNRGYIITTMGRRRRFINWEPRDWELSKKVRDEDRGPFTYEEALAEWGGADAEKGIVANPRNIRRAYTHKALNALLQGSAADLMKKAMVTIWRSGVCDVLGAPLLTVHDELAWSVPRTAEGKEAFEEANRLMETCHSLKVPVLVGAALGDNWGAAK